jgi:hypothetical protein
VFAVCLLCICCVFAVCLLCVFCCVFAVCLLCVFCCVFFAVCLLCLLLCVCCVFAACLLCLLCLLCVCCVCCWFSHFFPELAHDFALILAPIAHGALNMNNLFDPPDASFSCTTQVCPRRGRFLGAFACCLCVCCVFAVCLLLCVYCCVFAVCVQYAEF